MRLLAKGIALCVLIAALAVVWGTWLRPEPPILQVTTSQRFDGSIKLASEDAVPLEILESNNLVPYRLKEGETLGVVLDRLGASVEDRRQLVDLAGSQVDLRRLKPGNPYQVHYSDGRLARFDLGVEDRGELKMMRAGGAWSASYREFERSTEMVVVQGRLHSALEQAVRDAGAEGALTYKMADVFRWDLDFSRDLREGDEFEVVYERVYLDGQYRGLGEVVAAVYRGADRELRAYRYGEDGGYYDEDGKPLKKMFLRSPMKYSRVTSRFSRSRFHPVLKRYRPHYGVDYGAPRGTPVMVTANGTVVSAGWNGGAGRMVKVRHTNGYQTAYLHLSGYAKGVRSGARVRQGQVIGYVGSSGLSTGNHLDYRVQLNGKWIDPLSLNNLPADPIPVTEHRQFLVWKSMLDDALSSGTVHDQLANSFNASSSTESAS